MKYVKMLGLAAVAAAALMAFIGAGTASATVLCSVNEDPCSAANRWPIGSEIHFTLKSGTSANLVDTEGSTLDTCKSSTVLGDLSSDTTSPVPTTATGPITVLTWGSCTFTTDTTLKGGLEILANNTLKSTSETKVTINTVLFGSCVYGVTGGKSLGTLTEGASASFKANAVAERLSGSAIACPETSKWTAEYTYTGSTPLWVSEH